MRSPTFIIAEAGVNHNGEIDLAKRLIDIAVEGGADAVKFQTFDPQALVTPTAKKAAYQSRQDGDSSQQEMLNRLALKAEDFTVLKKHCQSRNIVFMSSAFDLGSVDILNRLGMTIFKIPSGEITNLPYLRKVGALGRKVILSTGMATMDEIRAALSALVKSGTAKTEITVLQCTTEYPAPMELVNLAAMGEIKREFDVAVGYSDHTLGIEAAIAAVAMGATVIEKHITLDKKMPGPDHASSLEPQELQGMVRAIRNIEKAIGSGRKVPSEIEMKNASVVRKSLVAAVDIRAGEEFSEKNLTVKRPGTGLSPMLWDEVVGKKAPRAFKANDLIVVEGGSNDNNR
jgi:N,N'-diacetyllegionaminate synthase